MENQAPISFTFLKKRRTIFLAGLLVGALQILLFVIYKKQGDILMKTLTDGRLFFKRLVLDLLLVDFLSIVILFFITIRIKDFVVRQYPNTLNEKIKCNLRYLPVVLIALFLFVPIAIILRHFIRNGFIFEAERLVKNFRNFGKLYVEFLIPFSLVGYLFFNINLYLQRLNTVKIIEPSIDTDTSKNKTINGLIEVINDNGNIMIRTDDIYWIEKTNKTYSVKTLESTFYVRKTIKQLEELLEPKGFLRINRGVIVNKNFLHNYSYWEYDKFILRMQDKDNTEFIVSRERMKQIKNQLMKVS